MPKVTNSYGPDGTLNTTMDREGMDIGPAPDYWADLENIRKRLKPMAPAKQQAQALGPEAPGPLNGPATSQPEYDFDPTFAVHKFPGGTGGGYMTPYTPGGMALGGGQAPVATGFTMTRRR